MRNGIIMISFRSRPPNLFILFAYAAMISNALRTTTVSWLRLPLMRAEMGVSFPEDLYGSGILRNPFADQFHHPQIVASQLGV